MTPDGTPVIGPTRYDNLYLNTGHGTLGFTMSCGSGRAVAEAEIGRKEALAAELEHWVGVGATVEELVDTRLTAVALVTVEASEADRLAADVALGAVPELGVAVESPAEDAAVGHRAGVLSEARNFTNRFVVDVHHAAVPRVFVVADVLPMGVSWGSVGRIAPADRGPVQSHRARMVRSGCDGAESRWPFVPLATENQGTPGQERKDNEPNPHRDTIT